MDRTINLIGEVGSQITAKKFIDAITKLGSGEPIEVNISSEGGSVFEALNIYDYLQTTSGQKFVFDANVTGMAASAGTIIAIALKAKIGANSYFMIHNAYTEELNPSTGKMALIDDINTKLLGIYTKYTGKPEAEIKQMMDAETMMDAHAAVEMGFCTGIGQTMAIAANLKGVEEWKGLLENRTIANYPIEVTNKAKEVLSILAKVGKGNLTELELARANQLAKGEPISQATYDAIIDSDLPIYGGANELLQTNEDKLINKLVKTIDMKFADAFKAFKTSLGVAPKAQLDITLDDGTEVYVDTENDTPVVGDMVYLSDGSPVPNAEHMYNGLVITTVDGQITDIKEAVAAEAKFAQAMELLSQAATENEALQAEVENLKAELLAIQNKRTPVVVNKVSKPTADKGVEPSKANGGMDVATKSFQAWGKRQGININ
jgi:ATP-dependent protease ClpP protease subunit